MLRWCAYCWTFLGERPPLEDFTPTHGACTSCSALEPDAQSAVMARAQGLTRYHRELIDSAIDGTIERQDVGELVGRGRALGAGGMEILFGVLQPALYEIGRLWEASRIHTSHEAALTGFCRTALSVLAEDQRARLAPPSGRPLVLACAPGNAHDLGLRIAAFALRESGRDVRVVPFPPPPHALVALARTVDADAVGVSIARSEEASYASAVVEAAGAAGYPLDVFLGGSGAIALAELPNGVRRWEGVRVDPTAS